MGQNVITIAQQKGGASKTTLTVHLAVALRQCGYRVAVIDIDPQGSISHWHKIRESRFGEGYTGLHFTQLSGWRVGSEVSRLKKHHDFVLIDSPPHVETEARTAIRNADLLLIPVQPSPTDLWATKATVDLAKAERVPFKVVLNRVNPQSKITETIGKELNGLAKTRLCNRVMYASALLEGLGVTEMAPSSSAAIEIKALVREVLAQLPGEMEEAAEIEQVEMA